MHDPSALKHALINTYFALLAADVFTRHATSPSHAPFASVETCGMRIHAPCDPLSSNHSPDAGLYVCPSFRCDVSSPIRHFRKYVCDASPCESDTETVNRSPAVGVTLLTERGVSSSAAETNGTINKRAPIISAPTAWIIRGLFRPTETLITEREDKR